LRRHKAIEEEGEGERGEGDDEYHTAVRISRREQGRAWQRAEMPVEEEADDDASVGGHAETELDGSSALRKTAVATGPSTRRGHDSRAT
jgi:hypothetical protein